MKTSNINKEESRIVKGSINSDLENIEPDNNLPSVEKKKKVLTVGIDHNSRTLFVHIEGYAQGDKINLPLKENEDFSFIVNEGQEDYFLTY